MTGVIDKDYLTFFTLIFCLSIGVFHHAEVFQFNERKFINCWPEGLCYWHLLYKVCSCVKSKG